MANQITWLFVVGIQLVILVSLLTAITKVRSLIGSMTDYREDN